MRSANIQLFSRTCQRDVQNAHFLFLLLAGDFRLDTFAHRVIDFRKAAFLAKIRGNTAVRIHQNRCALVSRIEAFSASCDKAYGKFKTFGLVYRHDPHRVRIFTRQEHRRHLRLFLNDRGDKRNKLVKSLIAAALKRSRIFVKHHQIRTHLGAVECFGKQLMLFFFIDERQYSRIAVQHP